MCTISQNGGKKNTGNREGERGMKGERDWSMLGPLCASHKHTVIFHFPSLFVATECSLWFLCGCNANRDSNIQRERKENECGKVIYAHRESFKMQFKWLTMKRIYCKKHKKNMLIS